MQYNAENNTNVKYILVQLPEPLDPNKNEQATAAEFCKKLDKPLNIAELTKERLRRAGNKIKSDFPDVDTGFRVFKLDSSNIKKWQTVQNEQDFERNLDNTENPIVDSRSDEDVFWEIAFAMGIEGNAEICQKVDGKCKVLHTGKDELFVFFGIIENVDVCEIIKDKKDSHIVFIDSVFKNDCVKQNVINTLKQNKFDTSRIKFI